MNILVINGSPKGEKSNSQILTETFLTGAKREGATVETLYVKDLNIHDCTGCYTCWTKTPGKCVFKDDMQNLLEKMGEADTVILATPLYHHGMTARLKKVIERTLPMVYPYIVNINGRYSHPTRSNKQPNYVVIANCGFPEMLNFKAMSAHFKALFEGQLKAEIYCTAGEFLNSTMKPYLAWYLNALEKAGSEFVLTGAISEASKAVLSRNLVEIETFLTFANESWKAGNENVPTVGEAMNGIYQPL